MTADTHSVLVVTKDSNFSSLAGAFLVPPLFEARVIGDFNEARRLVAERVYNIVLVDYSEGEGVDFATDISESLSTILLLTPQTLYEEISYQTTKLKNKMEEIRVVNRAKMLLMQTLKMTEQEAHRYVEKEAMDRGLKKTAVAEEVIRTYG